MKPPRTAKTPLEIGLAPAQTIEMLRELFRAYGLDPDTRSTDERQAIADKLSDAAGLRGRDRWGWRYIHNILAGHVQPGKKFSKTIMQLGMQVDGTPALQTQARPMTLMVIGEVHPNAVVLASSKPCKRPACPIHFVPDYPWRLYCCDSCRDQHRQEEKARKKAEREAKKHDESLI